MPGSAAERQENATAMASVDGEVILLNLEDEELITMLDTLYNKIVDALASTDGGAETPTDEELCVFLARVYGDGFDAKTCMKTVRFIATAAMHSGWALSPASRQALATIAEEMEHRTARVALRVAREKDKRDAVFGKMLIVMLSAYQPLLVMAAAGPNIIQSQLYEAEKMARQAQQLDTV